MEGHMFTISSIGLINGVVYFAAERGRVSIQDLFDAQSETIKSGETKYSKRPKDLARFAEALGLVKVEKNSVEITKRGTEYERMRSSEKWALSKDQIRLLRSFVDETPDRSPDIYAITTLQRLIRNGYRDKNLKERFQESIGKMDAWKTEVTKEDFLKFGINYLTDLEYIYENPYQPERDLPKEPRDLKQGQVLTNNEIHSLFGCSTQGGIRPSHTTNTIVLVSDHTIDLYGDWWDPGSGILHYTGMGRVGDQDIDSDRNRTLRDSKSSEMELFLFEVFKRNNYLYQGRIEHAGSPYQANQVDANGVARTVWMFPLSLAGGGAPTPVQDGWVEEVERRGVKQARRRSDSESHERAVQRHNPSIARSVLSKQYVRDPDVYDWTMRRAGGKCQLCNANAPFSDRSGAPYLEEHHVVWLARKGDDDIFNTVALCPNCHRKMHILDLAEDRVFLSRTAKEDKKE